MDAVRLEVQDAIATITLNRPEKYNALSNEIKEGLRRSLEQVKQDDSIRVLVLTGAGKAFSGGGDINGMGKSDLISGRKRLQQIHEVVLTLFNLEIPVICAVRGACVGAGLSLALACDVVIASETAKFSAIFRRVGLAPDAGAIYFLSRHLGLARAKELVFSARLLPANEARDMGLIATMVEDGQLESAAQELAQDYAGAPTRALAMGKRMFQFMGAPTLEGLLEMEALIQPQLLVGSDHQEGIAAFLEKRPAVFTGH